ncbi:hypothetical protein B0H14DRAFT_3436386 [Mycena olivaceomarginata]|nr:hypothetical protein B0H14DRAFT_3436386 [Mycena olivaceomarginata]
MPIPAQLDSTRACSPLPYSVPPSLCPSVPPSLRPSVPPSLRPSVPPSSPSPLSLLSLSPSPSPPFLATVIPAFPVSPLAPSRASDEMRQYDTP